MLSVRVLVVEDYEPFQRFICSTLEKRPELQVICSVSDGLEAVRKAEELQPDLILLDIGLPKLSGIEAARRIRKLSPDSKIIFLSQESSADVVQEALNLGALGYVVKAHAEELLAAVEAVRRGMQFVSRGLLGHNFTDAGYTQVPGSHAVQFYSDDALFLDGFTRFIAAALKAENTVIVVATESHRVSLLQRLQAAGVDVSAAVGRKRYIPLDVPDTLSPVQFVKVVNDLVVEAAGREHRRVAAS
jgi:CheY-like chemotaxis protein